MARGQLQDVLLVEVDLDAARVAPGARSCAIGNLVGGGPARRSRRARRWWPVAAVLVAGLMVGGLTSGMRARDRADRLAALPGGLVALRPSVHEAWRVPMRGWGQVAAWGDDLILFGPDAGGAEAVVSFVAATGVQRWLTPLPAATAPGEVWSCTPLVTAAYVVCRVAIPADLDEQRGVTPTAERTQIVVLDAGTGALMAQRTTLGAGASFAPLGRDLVVSEVLPDGHARVSRQDPVTGEVRWTFRSSRALQTLGASTRLSPSVQHGVVVVSGPVTWALSAEGSLLGEWNLQGGEWAVRGGWGLDLTVLPDGRFAVGESGGVGLSDADYGTVSATDARDGFRINGPVLDPVADDGSATDVLLTVPRGLGGVVAQDAATGKPLWSDGNMPWGSAVVLDRRLIVVVGRELRALDVHSGEVLWRVQIPRGNHAEQVFTDGRVTLVPRYDLAQGPCLAAFDPADGRALWTARLEPGVTRLEARGGRLVELTGRDLIVLG